MFWRLLHNEFLFFRTIRGAGKLTTVDPMLYDLNFSFCRMIEFILERKNFNVFLTFADCYKLLYDMPAPDIENIAYTNVCKQTIVTAKLPLDMFRRKKDMMRGLRFDVVGCFKDKSLSNPAIENTIQRMGGKVLSNTSADLFLMKHSSAPHCYLVVDNQQ